MRRVLFWFDEPREVAEGDYLFLIERLGGAMYSEALMLVSELSRGIPNVLEVSTPEMIENHALSVRGIAEISDERLRSLFRSLEVHSSQLWKLDQEMLEIIARYFHLETPLSNADRQKLHKKLNRHWLVSPTSDWRGSPRYLEIAGQCKEINLLLPKVKERMDDRLRELNEQMHEDI